MSEIYTQDMRVAGQSCPLCGTWHSAASCPPQFQEQSQKIAALLTRALTAEHELAQEQKAHDKIASLCFSVGASTSDGTSIGAVDDLILSYQTAERELAALKERMRWIDQAMMIVMQDGDSICYVLPDFVNLQVSPAIFLVLQGQHECELAVILERLQDMKKSRPRPEPPVASHD